MKITMSTITLQERAANVINSTTLGPRVAVELEPNVCVCCVCVCGKIKGITKTITILFGAKQITSDPWGCLA